MRCRHHFLRAARAAIGVVAAVCLLLVAGGPAHAQPADTTVALPGVTVTATRAAVPLAEAPARVTVLDAAALDGPAARSLADVLGARTGAFLKRYGGGGLATLALRGTGAAQTLVLLDGHRLADPQLGQLDLSLVPALLLESVEVMAGAASPLYGTDGLGGVVNLRTHTPGGAPLLKVRGGVGDFGERTGSALGAATHGRFSALALVAVERAEGDYPYLDRGRFPPAEVPRTGADRTHRTLFSTLGYEAPRRRLRVAAWYGDAERGLPTLAGTPRGERQWDESLRLWADGEQRFRRGTLRLGGLVQRAALRYRNQQLGLDETGRTLTATVEAGFQAVPHRRWLAEAGAEAGYGRAHHPRLADDARQHHLGTFVSGTGSFGRLLVYPALRADVYARAGTPARTSLNPRLGLNARLAEGLHAKAAAGRAFRMPTFNDRFWQPGGNPALRPERGRTYDAGLVLARRAHRAEVSVFVSQIRDQIVWRPVQAGVWRPENVQRVRSRGLEVSAESRRRLGRLGLDGGAFYTLTDARDRSDPAARSFDQPVRHVPRHEAKVHAGLGGGPLRLGLAARYTGRRYVTADGSEFLDPFFLLDADLRLRHAAGPVAATLGLAIENLLDRRYAVLPAQPMPPRHARLQLTLVF